MENFLNKLNKEQKKAVVFNNSSLVIIAGAGSGKTRTLTSKIAYLISNIKVNPYYILAVTFTNKAANEMKERVNQLLHEQGKRINNILTYHSLCARILRVSLPWCNKSLYKNDFTIIDQVDQLQIIKQIINSIDIEIDFKAKECLKMINNWKLQNISTDTIIKKSSEDDRALAIVYDNYEKQKIKNNYLDFADLINQTRLLLENCKKAREFWSNRFSHILIDEFQDTSENQYEIMKILSSNNSFLTIVGDPDQNIYSWRNAKSSFLMDFANNIKNVKIIKLEENYRSTKTIVKHSNLLIKNNHNRFEKTLFTNNELGEKIFFSRFQNFFREAKFIISKINELIHSGIVPSEIAVLYRSKYLSQEIEKNMTKNNILYRIYGGIRFYERKEIKDILAYAKAIFLYDDFSILRIINVPTRKIGTVTINKIKEYAEQNQISIFETITKNLDLITSLRNFDKTKIKNFVNLLKKYHDLNNEPYKTIKNLIQEINYFSIFTAEENETRFENYKEILRVIKQWSDDNPKKSFKIFLDEISLLSENNSDDKNNKEKVILSTIHTAKGLEFENVFILEMNEDVFPSHNAISNEEMEEERRLCYVAMTRAKKRLFLTSSDNKIFDSSKHQIVSRFIGEMQLNNNDYVYSYNDTQDKNFVDGEEVTHTKFGEGVIISIFGEFADIYFGSKWGNRTIKISNKNLRRK